MGVLNEVRRNAAAIAESAQHVRINNEAIPDYARATARLNVAKPELDATTHYLPPGDDPYGTLAFFITLDAINFGSGYFPHLKKRAGMSGYFTVASSLKDHFDAHGPLTATQLSVITSDQCVAIFGQSNSDEDVKELMKLFAQALNDLGGYVAESYEGSFSRMVEAAHASAERLVNILAQMPFYRDVGFYKRAQLTAADLALANVALFDDLDQLTIFADNLVPHVLRVDGVLDYAPELLQRINREELIPAGSREELEIRACALHAVELMKEHTPEQTAMSLDYVLWNRGQQPAFKAQPRHRTRTVYY